MTSARVRALLLGLAGTLGACGDQEVPAADFGARHFRDPRLSTSPFNAFSCATCHAVQPGAPAVVATRLDAGYNLAGVTERGRWWGGGELRLIDAVNVCVSYFMAGRRLEEGDEKARQLYAYLEASAAGAGPASAPAPFTIVRIVTSLKDVAGDAARGADLYRRSCHRCHGAISTAAGSLTPLAGKIPEDTIKAFPTNARAAVVEKIRHGRFFNVGGLMPLYSRETLSDQDVADMLAHMGL